ncbi:MAG: hypothetical protein E7394_01345 [Ruminococcaceae bacterium]|nr:hypothetical protein [Oscillospiraceae bacterium]
MAKKDTARGGVHYDEQSKTWGFRAIRDGKDIRKKGFAIKTEAKEARISFLAKHKEEKNKGPDSDTNIKLKDVYEHYMKFGSVEKKTGYPTQTAEYMGKSRGTRVRKPHYDKHRRWRTQKLLDSTVLQRFTL